MATREREKGNPQNKRENWTQFDRELIGAARDSKWVDLYFTLDAILRDKPEIECRVTAVDRYMIKVQAHDGIHVWIQKHLIAGVVVR